MCPHLVRAEPGDKHLQKRLRVIARLCSRPTRPLSSREGCVPRFLQLPPRAQGGGPCPGKCRLPYKPRSSPGASGLSSKEPQFILIIRQMVVGASSRALWRCRSNSSLSHVSALAKSLGCPLLLPTPLPQPLGGSTPCPEGRFLGGTCRPCDSSGASSRVLWLPPVLASVVWMEPHPRFAGRWHAAGRGHPTFTPQGRKRLSLCAPGEG